jgi:two-component system cell cycle response regulator DivK
MSKRILVVEDTENNRRILNDLLTNAGFEVVEAGDGEKGVAMAAKSRPDLILMDIQLPVVDGYQATRQIKSNPILRQIPIIAVTSYALSGDEAKARAADATGTSQNHIVRASFSPRYVNS